MTGCRCKKNAQHQDPGSEKKHDGAPPPGWNSAEQVEVIFFPDDLLHDDGEFGGATAAGGG